MNLRKLKDQSGPPFEPPCESTSGELTVAPVHLPRRHRRESGSSIVEVALLAPWIFFLFVGVFDFGFYAYASICTQNAARAAASRTAADEFSQSSALACTSALQEMNEVPNAVGLNSCAALPLIVTQKTLCGSAVIASITTCASPRVDCADCAADNTAASSQVTVTYQSIPMVPIPGVLTGRLNLTRIAEMRITAQ
jgi:Flp pilus assembly protein TadG